MRLGWLTCLFMMVVVGCKDEVILDNKNFNPRLVVDGSITNEPGPYIIKLSQTSPINQIKEVLLPGCTVTLYDNTGASEILTEVEPGFYYSSVSGIHGIVGNSYKISILTTDGKEYTTEFQEMKEPIEIDSVYADLTYVDLLEYPYKLPGYQFFTDTKIASGRENYYLWRMIETYEYIAEYELVEIINGNSTVADYQKLYRCWKTQMVNYVYTGTTANLTIPKIIHQPLHYVGTNTIKLNERYSLLLKQYSIDSKAYIFWKNMEDQFSTENLLFSTQPYNIIGNIKNVNNDDELVLGYFTVASVTQKRIFVDKPRVGFYFEASCAMNFNIDDLKRLPWPAYLVNTSDGRQAGVDERCVNCTSKGGVSTKPDFWVD